MGPVPILFFSDSPHLHTGLARIGRDLAVLASKLPQFRVGYLGRGGHGTSQLPFAQYNFPEADQWGEAHIESVWRDFAGERTGVIFTVWDASRLGWFANPIGMNGEWATLGEFLRGRHFQRWGYFPIDSYGVGRKLTGQMTDTISRYDRVLAYGMFGSDVISSSLGGRSVEWIPHGFNANVFTPRDRKAARMSMGVKEKELLIGCVMTNQARKDWGLTFATIARLKNAHPNLIFWAHVDVLQRHWDLRALTSDFGLMSSTIVTQSATLSDEELSYYYSACDLTILPSLGEGFGFPVVESMACGRPCITGSYGGAAEIVPNSAWLVDPVNERLDTIWNVIRPVYSPTDWVERIEEVLDGVDLINGEECRQAVSHLDWSLLWPSAWKKWFLEGLK